MASDERHLDRGDENGPCSCLKHGSFGRVAFAQRNRYATTRMMRVVCLLVLDAQVAEEWVDATQNESARKLKESCSAELRCLVGLCPWSKASRGLMHASFSLHGIDPRH